MITVIDDVLVQQMMLGRRIDVDGPITTTSHWWWRLAVAVRRGAGGALSGPALALPEPARVALASTIDRLDAALDITDFREVLPVAAAVAAAHRVNLLAAEALAVCLVDDADLVVGTHSPPLARAAEALGVSYRVAERAR
ncbi:MAG: hypothetical protein ACSLFP_11970 [Acidimicrobiales bacterium]